MSRFKEVLKKYGNVAIGVHLSVSAASITGLYVAIRNNVDVESMLDKVGMLGMSSLLKLKEKESESPPQNPELIVDPAAPPPPERNRTAEMAASSGGAFALALLINKALFPVRVPVTLALTPPIARFIARHKHSVW